VEPTTRFVRREASRGTPPDSDRILPSRPQLGAHTNDLHGPPTTRSHNAPGRKTTL
jgi:hypothetical protein